MYKIILDCAIFNIFLTVYIQQTYELLKQIKIEEIEVNYIGELKIPNLNIWKTLYFHLIKGEFEVFLLFR